MGFNSAILTWFCIKDLFSPRTEIALNYFKIAITEFYEHIIMLDVISKLENK